MRRRQRFLRGSDAALVSLRSHVPVMTAIIRREDRTLIEHKERRKVCVGEAEGLKNL